MCMGFECIFSSQSRSSFCGKGNELVAMEMNDSEILKDAPEDRVDVDDWFGNNRKDRVDRKKSL